MRSVSLCYRPPPAPPDAGVAQQGATTGAAQQFSAQLQSDMQHSAHTPWGPPPPAVPAPGGLDPAILAKLAVEAPNFPTTGDANVAMTSNKALPRRMEDYQDASGVTVSKHVLSKMDPGDSPEDDMLYRSKRLMRLTPENNDFTQTLLTGTFYERDPTEHEIDIHQMLIRCNDLGGIADSGDFTGGWGAPPGSGPGGTASLGWDTLNREPEFPTANVKSKLFEGPSRPPLDSQAAEKLVNLSKDSLMMSFGVNYYDVAQGVEPGMHFQSQGPHFDPQKLDYSYDRLQGQNIYLPDGPTKVELARAMRARTVESGKMLRGLVKAGSKSGPTSADEFGPGTLPQSIGQDKHWKRMFDDLGGVGEYDAKGEQRENTLHRKLMLKREQRVRDLLYDNEQRRQKLISIAESLSPVTLAAEVRRDSKQSAKQSKQSKKSGSVVSASTKKSPASSKKSAAAETEEELLMTDVVDGEEEEEGEEDEGGGFFNWFGGGEEATATEGAPEPPEPTEDEAAWSSLSEEIAAQEASQAAETEE